MTEKVQKLGSQAWRDWVWTSPPVDILKGRSRWTQTHQPWMGSLGRHAAVQGRPEYVSLLALDYLRTLGLVKRFKEHPFYTGEDDLGWEIRPDAMAEDASDEIFVIEIKTARFVTEAVRLQLNENRKGLKKFGLKYLFWTDQHPLNYAVRHNLINMRRAASEEIAEQELAGLQELVSRKGVVTVVEAVKQGYDLNCVFSAWWHGHVYLPLAHRVDAQTLIRNCSTENHRAIFFEEKAIVDDWWDTLIPG